MSIEIVQHIGTSNPNGTHEPALCNGPALINVPNSPQTSGSRSVNLNPPNVRPHTTMESRSEITAQSTPHRAWEAGYQSPFARTFHHPLNPPHHDTQLGHYSYNTDSPSNAPQVTQNDYSTLPTVNPSTQSVPPPLAMDITSLQYSSIPQHTTPYRPRIRKVVTKEITLNDIDITAMVALGMSPFMVGQDMIANQNRFVRNECVFARQFLRLQHATGDADARHSKTERDIYKHLEQHKAALDGFASGLGSATLASNITSSHSVRADHDFLALEKAHQETCARLEELSRQVKEYSQSTRRTLMDLAQHIDQITRMGNYFTNSDVIPGSHATTTPLSPFILSTSNPNLKRKWNSSSDSILESPSTAPPSTPDFSFNHQLSRA